MELSTIPFHYLLTCEEHFNEAQGGVSFEDCCAGRCVARKGGGGGAGGGGGSDGVDGNTGVGCASIALKV